MAHALLHRLIRHLRARAPAGAAPDPTDGELLERFLDRRDEAAFEALLCRHGPMVFGVCRRLLGTCADVEDAFQAVFLVFVRKAATVWPRDRVGAWLHGVACNTARKARAVQVHRQAREKPLPSEARLATEAHSDGDWLPLLDEELRRLPGKSGFPGSRRPAGRQTPDAQQAGWPTTPTSKIRSASSTAECV
jgi:RNA polymerase sigma-70 factor (ECF subfamily)